MFVNARSQENDLLFLKPPNVAKELTGGCKGFATEFMQWAEELVVGGTEKDNNTLTRFVVGRPSCSESSVSGFPPLTGVQRCGGSRGREKGGALPRLLPPPACPCPSQRLPHMLPLLKIPILELLDVSQVNRLR